MTKARKARVLKVSETVRRIWKAHQEVGDVKAMFDMGIASEPTIRQALNDGRASAETATAISQYFAAKARRKKEEEKENERALLAELKDA